MIGMFSLDTVLENRSIVRKVRGAAAIHVISTLATRYRARYTLCLESIPTLVDFLLKPLFAQHISSISLCHSSSLPQSWGRDEVFSHTFCGRHPARLHDCRYPSGESTTVGNRWDEKAGLRRDAVGSQVIDALEAQEIKETGNEED